MHDSPPNGAPSSRKILVVAGSGRSGTSLFTGLTSHLGVHVPKPEVKANSTNPRGFSEPRWAVDFHKELMVKCHVRVEDGRPEAWDLARRIGARPHNRARLTEWVEQQFAESPRIVIKDPRLAWFFSLYQAVAEETGSELVVATMLRHPAEVLRSREIHYNTRTANTTRAVGWINKMLGSERFTRDLPRAVVFYPDLLSDWRGALTKADESMGMGLISQATEQQLEAAGQLVDPALRRSETDWEHVGVTPRVQDLAERSHEAIARLVGRTGDQQDDVRRELDDLWEEFTELYSEADEIVLDRTNERVRVQRRKATREARRMAASTPRQPLSTREHARAALAGVRRKGGALLRRPQPRG